jgi:hypothetical protein
MQVEAFTLNVSGLGRSSRVVTVAKFVFKCTALKDLELSLPIANVDIAVFFVALALCFFQTASDFFVIFLVDNRIVRIL